LPQLARRKRGKDRYRGCAPDRPSVPQRPLLKFRPWSLEPHERIRQSSYIGQREKYMTNTQRPKRKHMPLGALFSSIRMVMVAILLS
jgi:hypothetical protein